MRAACGYAAASGYPNKKAGESPLICNLGTKRYPELLLIIIGESRRNVSPELREKHPVVPWRQIVGKQKEHVIVGITKIKSHE